MKWVNNKFGSCKFNYLGFAVTNWHLIGAKAGEEYLKELGIKVKAQYLLVEHPKQGFLNLDTYNIECRKVDVCKAFNVFSLLRLLIYCFSLSETGDRLYIGMPWSINIKLLAIVCNTSNFKCIIYEEGAKSYNLKYQNLWYILKKYGIKAFLNRMFALCLQKWLKHKGKIIDIHPLLRVQNKLLVNDCTSGLYRKVMKIEPVVLNKDNVLIVMQSIESEYIRVILEIVPLLHTMGKKVFIKEHPRFPLKNSLKCKAEFICDSRSLEVLMPEIKAKYVLGFFSTALVTTKMFFNVIPISLYRLMDRKKLPREIDDLCMWFKETFEDVVNYPASKSDFFSSLRIFDGNE